MKRPYVIPALGIIALATFQKENESVECKQPLCAVEQSVIMPEPQHVPEELFHYSAPEGMVAINTSPITFREARVSS